MMQLELYEQIRDEELKSIGDRSLIHKAAALFDRFTKNDQLDDFLTMSAYEELLKLEQGGTHA